MRIQRRWLTAIVSDQFLFSASIVPAGTFAAIAAPLIDIKQTVNSVNVNIFDLC